MLYQSFSMPQKQVEYIQKAAELVCTAYGNPKAYVHTYGCQQNTSDSEKIKGMLQSMGYQIITELTQADLILFNTCAIREGAEEKIFGNVGELKRIKREKADTKIVLCGCMVQQETILTRIQKSYPFVDLVFGTHVLHRLPEFIYRVLSENRKVFCIEDTIHGIAENIPLYRESGIKANVPIMNGCNNFCTYCIVPYVRGRECSRTPEEVLQEVSQLVKQGYKEITLLGQNVNSYGKGLAEEIDFSHLLKKINALEGDFWIRFMTSHPKDCTKKLLDTIATCEKVCKHIHLPVQSGNNVVLKGMNRSYTREMYLELVQYAGKIMPEISFSSDMIVGFPQETYEQFQDTLSLVREVQYHQLYTFLYSRRPGTKAETFPDPIPSAEKSKWLRELLQVQSEVGLQLHEELIGKTFTVLVDGYGKCEEGCLSGRTYHNIIVDFMGEETCIGNYVTIEITKATPWATFGKLISPCMKENLTVQTVK